MTEKTTHPAADKLVGAVVAKKDPRKSLHYVIVRHLLGAEGERDNAIPVNDLGDYSHGRAVCIPGNETLLSEVQINILNEAVEEYTHEVPDGSGIYEAPNPLAEAKKHFPGFRAYIDTNTQAVMLKKERKRFSVEVVKPYKPTEKE